MRKGWIIAIICILLLLIGSLIAIYMYKINQLQNDNMLANRELAQVEIDEEYINDKIVSTSVNQEKISPNSVLIEKQYFNGCDHLIKNIIDMPEGYINLTEQEIQKLLPEWSIEKFSSNEVVIYQEKDGFCNQHYLIKDNNGVLGIYTIDEDGKQTLKENTEIQTQYLTEIDLEKMQEGIEVIGDIELNTILEDFE